MVVDRHVCPHFFYFYVAGHESWNQPSCKIQKHGYGDAAECKQKFGGPDTCEIYIQRHFEKVL